MPTRSFLHLVLRAALVLVLTSAAPAFASHTHASLAELSLEQLGEIVVSSVSRRDERLSEVAASVYVIGREEIRRSGAASLPEVLRLAPNLQVARVNTSDYAITARGGNSTTANKLQVMIDGRTVYTPLFSGVFWDAQSVPLNEVERIEVISGPGAAVWGANAVNGVINVITRSAADSRGNYGELSAGSRERSVAVRHGRTLDGGLHVRVYGSASQRTAAADAGGASGNDRARHGQAGWRADWDSGSDRWTLQGDMYKGRIDQNPADREISGANLLGRLQRALGDGATLTLQAYFDSTERDVPQSFRERLETVDLDIQHALAPRNGHAVIWGGGLRHARDRVQNSDALQFLPPRRTLSHAQLFVQDQWTINDELGLSAGVKLEHNPYTGLELMPDLRVSYRLAEQGLLWASLARAVRAPSRLDREFFIPASGGNPALLGGPQFRSEIAHVAELGYRAQPAPGLSYSMTAFHHDYRRLRSLEPVPGGSVLENRIVGTTSGIEAWGSMQATRAWRLGGGFVVMNVDRRRRSGGIDQRDLRVLGNDPDLTLQLRLSYTPDERSEYDLMLRHVGALPDPAVPAYTTFDLRAAWRLTPGFELALIGRNLLERRHPEWGPGGVRAEFGREIALKLIWRQ